MYHPMRAMLPCMQQHTKLKAFTKRVIQRSFKATGIFPFDPDQIFELAKKNAGHIANEAKDCRVQCMKRAAETVLDRGTKRNQIRSVRIRPHSNTLLSPMAIVAADDERIKNEAKKISEKEEAAKTKKDDHENYICMQTCLAEGCTKRSNIQGGAAQWGTCRTYNRIFESSQGTFGRPCCSMRALYQSIF